MSSPHAHDFGPVGDEAAKLLEAVQGWARATFGEGANARISTDGPDDNVLKLKPPLVLSRDDCAHCLEALDASL